jgi:predicted nucleic acid-binding protein
MYRVVLDPIVILRGLINPHSICGSLLSDYASRYKVVFSAEMGQALIFLPHHPMLIAKYPRLARLDPRQAGRLLARAEKVHIDLALHPNVVVATAIAAQAGYLICEDAQLLAVRDKIPVPILSAAAFIALLASEPPL